MIGKTIAQRFIQNQSQKIRWSTHPIPGNIGIEHNGVIGNFTIVINNYIGRTTEIEIFHGGNDPVITRSLDRKDWKMQDVKQWCLAKVKELEEQINKS